jgi:hypothetical protein
MSGPRLRPARPEERQLAALWAAAAASAVALRPLWLVVAPHLRRCAFRGLTGMPCPTCGTTRTAVALLGLDLAGAIRANPLAAVAGIVFVVGGAAALGWLALGGRSLPELGWHWSRWWTAAAVGLVAANWLYLIASG